MFRYQSPPDNFENIVVYFARLLLPEYYLEIGSGSDGIRIREVAKFTKRSIGVDVAPMTNYWKTRRIYEFYNMTSDNFFDRVEAKEIEVPQFDMVFIDGWHSFEQSYVDFANVLPYVEKNGLIFLHDTLSCPVKDTLKALQDQDYRFVNINLLPGIAIVQKGVK